jgi:hypothetical protein
MIWIAFQMLTGDRAKYFGILVGFPSLLCSLLSKARFSVA